MDACTLSRWRDPPDRAENAGFLTVRVWWMHLLNGPMRNIGLIVHCQDDTRFQLDRGRVAQITVRSVIAQYYLVKQIPIHPINTQAGTFAKRGATITVRAKDSPVIQKN
jgi:hypothetical protein